MNASVKRNCFMGIFCAIMAILVAVLYYLQLFDSLSVYYSIGYITYFCGLAMTYAGAHCRSLGYRKTKIFCYLVGVLFILGSLASVVYGYYTGNITFALTY